MEPVRNKLTEKPLWRRLNSRLPARLSLLGLFLAMAAALPPAAWLARESGPIRSAQALGLNHPYAHSVRPDLNAPDSLPGFTGMAPPEKVKGIYVTADTVAWRSRFAALVEMAERTELNTLVIDIKDHRSRIAFETDDPELRPYRADRPLLGDLRALTESLHEKGLYLVARLFVFQDQEFAAKNPEYAVKKSWGGLWRDYRGLLWLDPAAQPVWEYNAKIAVAAVEGGFDEVQFDYIRFPSDGNLKSISYPYWDGQKSKAEVMADFFRYLDRELRRKRGILTSVDLFGLTMWQHDYDLNIGQRLDKAAPYFDFVSPMVYPSHYPSGFAGLRNPAAHPYQVVHDNLVRGQEKLDRLREQAGPDERVSELRPWIQDFHLGAHYGPERVRAQIRASDEAETSGWLLWNAANRYTEAALEASDSLQ